MMTMKAEGEPIEYLYNVFEVHLGVYVAQFSTGRHHTAVDIGGCRPGHARAMTGLFSLETTPLPHPYRRGPRY